MAHHPEDRGGEVIVTLPRIAGHSTEELIRDDDHEWVVRTRFGGRTASTRIARIALPIGADGQLRASVLAGAPLDETLPWELRRILEGHRVRASLPTEWPLPTVLAAGLGDDGHPYVTRAWIDGVALGRAFPTAAPHVRDDALEQLLWLLERLHARGIVVQDLKPDNVVLDAGGRVWLVDLESLRNAPAGAIPCTHYTPRYAAPEQLVGRSSAPSSDLFAFGRLCNELADGNPRWSTLAAACLVLDPRLRPTASEAVRWVHGAVPAAADATIRVDEPVPSANGPAEAPLVVVPVDPPRRSASGWRARLRRSAWRVWGVLGAVGLLAGIGLFLGEPPKPRDPDPQAANLVQLVRDGLRDHKVVAAKNNDLELSRLLVTAQQAALLDPTADALGETALATVWSQRWHWRGARWDPAAFAIADRVTRVAIDAGETPEAVLGRGLAAAAACRHGPSSLADREAWCDEAVARLDRAAKIGADWLAVEARWGAVMVLNTRARRSLDRYQSAQADAGAALARCDLAAPLLPSAPVNGIELVEDCLWAAGAARDQDAWHRWAGWWLAHQKTSPGPTSTAFLVRSAAPECARLTVGTDGLPVTLEDGSWSAWCTAMTARTLRCVDGGGRPAWCPH